MVNCVPSFEAHEVIMFGNSYGHIEPSAVRAASRTLSDSIEKSVNQALIAQTVVSSSSNSSSR